MSRTTSPGTCSTRSRSRDLNELYGQEFSKRYAEYAAMAEAGELKMFKKMGAREQFKAILISLQGTSHPWLTWKDTINNRAINNNTGTIHLSNLCTEICLPQDVDNVSVCNLASINLSMHLIDGKMDWGLVEESARVAVRQLDNLIDITRSSVDEADYSNEQNRAVGLGVMGFTDIIEKLGYSYESEEAYDLIDEIMEHVAYAAIDESTELAKERGSYPNFEGSRWSQGLVPFDTIDLAEADRGIEIEVPRTTRLDWDALREKVKGGMAQRHSDGDRTDRLDWSGCGGPPRVSTRSSRRSSARATSSGKFLEVNRNLVEALRERGLWESTREQILQSQGGHSGHRQHPRGHQRGLQDELPALTLCLPRGGSSRPEVDRPGNQPEHVPRNPRHR